MKTAKEHLNTNIPLPRVNPQVSYQIRQAFLLSLVPLFCGMLLMLLLFVFAKLNLYYLEANGLILDSQVRDAYYLQVQVEILGVIGFLVAQTLMTAAVTFVVMRWATAPFTNAYRMLELAVNSPDAMKPMSRWLSESPKFDSVIFDFCRKIRGEQTAPAQETDTYFQINLRFLVKFLAATAALSVLTGYVTTIIFGTIYRHIVDLALQLVQSSRSMPHYFLAQEEILSDGAFLLSLISFAVFACLGIQIARYMANMVFVFSRAIQEDKFPITLRSNDVYKDLAAALNEARVKIS
ncbi:MAG: hypothetical protein AB7K68_12685 [Bacteriovoracia bacterium]